MSFLLGLQLVFILAAIVCSGLVSIRGAESFSMKTLCAMLAVACLGGVAAMNMMINGVPK